MKSIFVHLADGFEEIEAITIIDVLRRSGLNVVTLSISDKLMVNGAHKIGVEADLLFKNADYKQADMIVLPGGMPGAKNLSEHEGLNFQLKKFFEEGKLLGAICAAPMVLGKLGILKGKKVVCYPGFENYLHGAIIKEEPVVTDGNIITGRGPGAAMQFSYEIVRLLKDEQNVAELREAMLTTV
jgi:4-methyl-5(b-hydroxyethyl)-thiazole monophosphate biosynthesis